MKNRRFPIILAATALLVITTGAFADRDDHKGDRDRKNDSPVVNREHQRDSQKRDGRNHWGDRRGDNRDFNRDRRDDRRDNDRKSKPRTGIQFNFGFYSSSRPTWGSVHRSPYHRYGHIPPYIQRDRIIVLDRPSIIIRGDYYLNRTRHADSYQRTLDDIRDSWLRNEITFISLHVRNSDNIAVYQDGKYDYSMKGDDYRAMTQDAMAEITTRSFDFTRIDDRNPNQVNVVARHVFRDRDGSIETVYASYLLTRSGRDWWITAVGSSDNEMIIR